ncbi:hypothetical protein AAG906_024198 [Vitis piasezkii]
MSKSNSSLFIHHKNEFIMFLFVYVDGLIITDTSSQLVQRFTTTLAQLFSLKDLSPLAYFLGVEAIHTSSGLFLSQYKYIHDLLEKHNKLGANDVSIPLSSIMSFKGFFSISKALFILASFFISTLHAFADVDWVGNSNDHTSTSTYVMFLRCNPIG